MSKKNNNQIQFNVALDEKNIPEKITWNATNSSFEKDKETKSIMISVWDAEDKNTLRLDLWTKEMRIDEMRNHFMQTLVTSAESFHKATGNPFVMADMKKFCEELAEKTNKWEKESGKAG